MPEPQAAPKIIPGTLAYAERVFSYVETGWITAGGAAASVPGVVQGITGISLNNGRITVSFTLDIGGVALPAKLEITPTVLALSVAPSFRVQVSYAIPYWDALMGALRGEETPLEGTPYAITLPTPSATSVVVPKIKTVGGDDPKITFDFPAPYPKVGSGMLWAYMRGVTFDQDGATLDIYRPVLGFDLAKNPRFLWGE